MSTANIGFWLAALALLFILEACLCYGLTRRKTDSSTEPSLNRLVYQDELQALQRELSEGRLSQDRYDESVQELQVRILHESEVASVTYREHTWTGPVSLALVLALPFFALFLYFRCANPSLVAYSGAPGAVEQVLPAENLSQLQKFLKENPKDVRAWIALSDEYAAARAFKEACAAMDEAMKYSPNGVAVQPDYLLQRAVYRLESGDPVLRSGAVGDIDQALKIEPNHAKALELGGIVAYSTGNYKKAVDYWQELLLQLPPDSKAYARLLDAISDAKNREGFNF